MHRVRVPTLSGVITLDAREYRHLRVLRLAAGDTVRVFDGRGNEAHATIERLDESGAELLLGEPIANPTETPQPVTLAVALLKGDKLADVVRAATELGAHDVQLLQTRYADVPDISSNKLDRLRRVATEASKQSRRAVVPAVHAPVRVRDLPAPTGQGFIAHPGSDARLHDVLDWRGPVTLVSGPEGGFADEEVHALQARGYLTVTLGPRILRAETAPVALLGAIAATGA